MIELKVTTKGLRDARGRYTKAAEGVPLTMRQNMQMLMQSLVDAVRPFAPKNLARYVGYRTEMLGRDRVRGEVILKSLPGKYPDELWDYIIEGTRPHVIEAKRARALHFYWDKKGEEVFFKRVNHPGTAPNPFVRTTYERVGLRQIQQAAERIGLAITRVIGGGG